MSRSSRSLAPARARARLARRARAAARRARGLDVGVGDEPREQVRPERVARRAPPRADHARGERVDDARARRDGALGARDAERAARAPRGVEEALAAVVLELVERARERGRRGVARERVELDAERDRREHVHRQPREQLAHVDRGRRRAARRRRAQARDEPLGVRRGHARALAQQARAEHARADLAVAAPRRTVGRHDAALAEELRVQRARARALLVVVEVVAQHVPEHLGPRDDDRAAVEQPEPRAADRPRRAAEARARLDEEVGEAPHLARDAQQAAEVRNALELRRRGREPRGPRARDEDGQEEQRGARPRPLARRDRECSMHGRAAAPPPPRGARGISVNLPETVLKRPGGVTLLMLQDHAIVR